MDFTSQNSLLINGRSGRAISIAGIVWGRWYQPYFSASVLIITDITNCQYSRQRLLWSSAVHQTMVMSWCDTTTNSGFASYSYQCSTQTQTPLLFSPQRALCTMKVPRGRMKSLSTGLIGYIGSANIFIRNNVSIHPSGQWNLCPSETVRDAPVHRARMVRFISHLLRTSFTSLTCFFASHAKKTKWFCHVIGVKFVFFMSLFHWITLQ